MSDSAQLLSRILMSIVFIVFGYLQFTNIAGYAANPSVLKVVALTGGILSPTVFAYLVAAIDLFGGILILVGFQTRWAALASLSFVSARSLSRIISGPWRARRAPATWATSTRISPSSADCCC